MNECKTEYIKTYVNECKTEYIYKPMWMNTKQNIYINQCEWMQNRIYSKPHIKEEVEKAKNYETLLNITNVTFKADSEQWTSLVLITVEECDKIS